MRLHPLDIIARVSGNAGGFSSHAAARQRELEVSRYLAAKGAPVIPPSSAIAAGPFEEDGLIVSFWGFVVKSDQRMKKVNALPALHACHKALANYPGELPFLQGYADARRLFLRFWRDDDLEVDEVHEILERISEMNDALAEMKENLLSQSMAMCISATRFSPAMAVILPSYGLTGKMCAAVRSNGIMPA
ncbi:MAG: hypothetical protein ACKVH0_19640 [Alphaproteobacteria bacterium]|jgi:hypothetical protein